MQIVSLVDNFHEQLKPIFWEKLKKHYNLSSDELAQRVVKVCCRNSEILNFAFLPEENINWDFC